MMLFRLLIGKFLLCVICLPLMAVQPQPEKIATLSGYGGAVATISAAASQAALTILQQGGNAIDAAVAAAAVLGVTDPFSCGIGGGGFMLLHYAKDGRIVSIDHRETAPNSASSTMFSGKDVDKNNIVASGLSVGVPGTIRGWHEALTRFGTRTLAQVLEPAILVAEKGFIIDENFHRLTSVNEKKFALFSSSSKLFLKNNQALPIGTLFKNPDLARTYREIAEHGVRYFYEDKPARAIVASIEHPPVVKGAKVAPGKMTMADLANYEARIRLPLHSTYRGYDIYGMALPSSGGVVIAEALNILEGFDLASMTRDQVEHLYLESSRLAFADRNKYLADPEFMTVPVEGLLSKSYAAERRKLIKRDKAHSSNASAGNPFVYQNGLQMGDKNAAKASSELGEESMHTTHLTVSDKWGNIVAYTFTIEDWGGSGIVVPEHGFLLNNEMTDFDFSSSAANRPEPRKRPRSSMSPTLIFKDGKPLISVGSPGGPTIITTVLQILVNFFDLKMSLSEALAAPRMSQKNSDTTLIEPSLVGTITANILMKKGHKWSLEPAEIGAANAIFFGADGTVTAVSEPSRHGRGSALIESKRPIAKPSPKAIHSKGTLGVGLPENTVGAT